MSVCVLETGELNVRVGVSGGERPSHTFLNKTIELSGARPFADRDRLFGAEADFLQPIYECVAPLRDGRVADWEAMEAVWLYAIECAASATFGRREKSLQLLLGFDHSAADRSRVAAFFFEQQLAEEIAFAPAGAVALYANGRTTGLVLDAGFGGVRAVPVSDGCFERRWLRQNRFGGAALSRAVSEGVRDSRGAIVCHEDVLMAVKSQHAAVIDRRLRGRARDERIVCDLPDGTRVVTGNELTDAFKEFYGFEESDFGAADCVLSALKAFDHRTRAELARRILPTGASTCFQSFEAILAQCLSDKSPFHFDFLPNEDRADAAFKGAALLAAIRDGNAFVTRREFEERGAC